MLCGPSPKDRATKEQVFLTSGSYPSNDLSLNSSCNFLLMIGKVLF